MLQAVRSQVRLAISLVFNRSNLSSLIMILGSTQPLTETSVKSRPEEEVRLAFKSDTLTAVCELCLEIVGTSTFHNPVSLYVLLQKWISLSLVITKYPDWKENICSTISFNF
jgi:hypothetical protein